MTRLFSSLPERPAPRFEAPADEEARGIRLALGAWFEAERRDLPWRRTRDPYGIWVSEAMLQQTRVEVVLDYWPRFLGAFPTIQSLADADEQAVLEAWSGLGYYRRARSLKAAAQVMVERHGGQFPRDLEAALALPGIGPYTAGAVLSIAFDQPTAIVDGNVERVFSRLFGLDGVRTSGPLQRAAWEAARFFVGRTEDGVAPGHWNQALMELGALVCTPRSPGCDRCPLRGPCRARAAGAPEQLPRARPPKAVLEVELEIFAVQRSGQWLVVRRPAEGRMAGLWEFPTVETTGLGLFPGELTAPWAAGLEPEHDLFELRHAITCHRIGARVRAARLHGQAQGPGTRWGDPAELGGLALTGMARKVLARLA